MGRGEHPLPLLCVGSAFIPLAGSGLQATTSEGQKLVCVERSGKHASKQYLKVPLNFGLEMVACFPKSYRWLSEEAASRSQGSGHASTSTSKAEDAASESLRDVTVYSLKDVSVVQISDDHKQQPIEYKTCFTSRTSLEEAWKAGRGYLLAATLANRASIRQKVINAVHRKFARVAVSGSVPPFGVGPPAETANEDEDGLLEPPEVQQLAAELNMQNIPDTALLGGPPGGSPPPALAQFGATMLCGMISLVGPIAQTLSGAMDGLFGAIPVLDRIVIGESVPPRKAPIEAHSIQSLLLDAAQQNSTAGSHASLGKGMDKRLATSALWMGVGIQLILSQYLASTMSSETASILLASRARGHGQGSGPGHGAHRIPKEPVVMDVFSGLLTSMQGNEFVREATNGEENDAGTSLVSAAELEQVLMRNNGLEIGFKRKDSGNVNSASGAGVARGKGIILIGSLGDTPDARNGKRESPLALTSFSSMPPVGVINASKLLGQPGQTNNV